MSGKQTQEIFLEKATKVHGDKYDYSKVVYEGSQIKVDIICKMHGTFLQSPANHIRGQGCRACGSERNRIASKELTKDFISAVSIIHNGKYSYSKLMSEYRTERIVVGCPIHGDFEISSASHKSGRGCKKCGVETVSIKTRHSTDEFIKLSNLVHDNKYNYSKTNYINSSTKVTIICPTHGDFTVQAGSHQSGIGCKTCGIESTKTKRRSTLQHFEIIASKVHSNFYDYSNISNYTNDTTPIEIICPLHGLFLQTPSAHKAGKGCVQCNPGGYSKSIRGNFYILRSDNITKVGITNKLPSIRARKINNSSNLNFKVDFIISDDNGDVAFKIEQACKIWLSQRYVGVDKIFDGYTECFLDVDMNQLLAYIATIYKQGNQCPLT